MHGKMYEDLSQNEPVPLQVSKQRSLIMDEVACYDLDGVDAPLKKGASVV